MLIWKDQCGDIDKLPCFSLCTQNARKSCWCQYHLFFAFYKLKTIPTKQDM